MTIRPLVVGLLLGSVSLAQAPAPGHRLLSTTFDTNTRLVDVKGAVVHTWASTFRPGLAAYVEPDGTLLRTIETTPISIGGGEGGGLQRVALDGTVLWDFRYDGPGVLSHHDVAILPNGNVLMVAWEEKTRAETIAAGRDPAHAPGTFRPTHIIEVQQTGPTSGAIVWEWHVWDHLIQDFDSNQPNYGVVGNHPELVDINYPPGTPGTGDWLHVNGIDHDPVYDRILFSPLNAHEIWVIDHSTTTQEAAGHTGGRWGKGGDLLYRWGNPAAYRAGTTLQQRFRTHHGPRFVPAGYPGAGNLLVFVNRINANPQSSVYELAPPLDASGNFVLGAGGRYGPGDPKWVYSAPGFYSSHVSSADRLPNGNTLICSGTQRRVFEVTPAGQTVADFTAPTSFGTWVFNAQYVERSLWSDRGDISVSAGGSVNFELIAGSQHAARAYALLGSVSGTTPGIVLSGVPVPLNVDSWTMTTLTSANTPVLMQTVGLTDTEGRASSSIHLPAGLPAALIGLRFDHAFVVVDLAGSTVTAASNAGRFELVQ